MLKAYTLELLTQSNNSREFHNLLEKSMGHYWRLELLCTYSTHFPSVVSITAMFQTPFSNGQLALASSTDHHSLAP